MSRIFYGIRLMVTLCMVLLLGACLTPVPSSDDIVGVWTFEARGEGTRSSEEAAGTVEFFADGRVEAIGVSSLVTKSELNGIFNAVGIWRIPKQNKNLSGVLSRRWVEVIFSENDIPINAYYESWGGESTLTFARDEESGEWVHYTKSS